MKRKLPEFGLFQGDRIRIADVKTELDPSVWSEVSVEDENGQVWYPFKHAGPAALGEDEHGNILL